MGKMFKYQRPMEYRGERYSYDFDYEIEDERIDKALIEILVDYYFGDILVKYPELEKQFEKKVVDCMKELNARDRLVDAFEEELKEIFKEEALESEGGNYYD